MSFVYPQFLWALTALSIPLIIHLFNFRKTIRIYFSNTRLLRLVQEATTQKRKLKQLLVLAARLLFLFFLIMAFAQPFIPAREQFTSGRSLVIYLDNSYSMTLEESAQTRALDAAINRVQEVLEVFPPDTRYKLITNDFAPFSNSFKTKAEITDLLSQLRLSPVSRSMAEVKKRIGTLSGSDIFLVSDFQKSTLGDVPLADSINHWHLVQVKTLPVANVLVDTIYLENPFQIGGEKNTVTIRVKNDGKEEIPHLSVKLILNENLAATTTLTLASRGTAKASFDLPPVRDGFVKGVVALQDFPVTFDNDFHFALNPTDRVRVAEVTNDKGASKYFSRVYGNELLFDFKSFKQSNTDYTALDHADLVVLNQIDRLDATLIRFISSKRKGVLLLVPGTQPDIDSYQKVLSSRIKPAMAASMENLEAPDFKNPLFQNVFEERSSAIAMPRAMPSIDWGADRSAALKFRNGNPFLSQMRNIYLLACPVDVQYTDFGNHALFVPIMYRIAVSGKSDFRPIYYFLSSALVNLPADSLRGEEVVRLTGPQEIIPPQRFYSGSVALDVPRFSASPGFYFATVQSDTLGLIAFNLDKQESYLETLDSEEVKARMGGGDHISFFDAASARAFGDEIKERYLGTPLWKYALVLALLFLLAEVLLIRFMK